MPNTLVLIHGYADIGDSFKKWRDELVASGLYKKENIQLCNYLTLTEEMQQVILLTAINTFKRFLPEQFY